MPPSICPNTPELQAVLEYGTTDGQPGDLLRHLDTCVVCQRALETLAGDSAAWEEAASGLVEGVWNEPALQHVVAHLKTEEFLEQEDKDLSFLRPAGKPGLVGLFGSYAVLGEIGRGGMGIVLKALDPVLNRVVALKVLSPRLATSATARQRFLREGRAAAAVCHDHIVTVYGVSEADGLPYLIMQYITGESLQDRLDRTGPLELEEIVQIGLQTAAGLAAAHGQGLIHRDIKPANLLLESLSPPIPFRLGESGPGTRVKITDFGLARLTDDVHLTQNGVLAGTPEYMAPEQARGEQVDHRADLFSLGSVLYAMGTGVSPFRGSTTLALIRQVSEEMPPPMRTLNPDVPVWLEALVARLMAKNLADRFQSAAEVATLLEGYLSHLREPTTVPAPELPAPIDYSWLKVPSPESRTEHAPRFRKPFWMAAFLLLATVALGLGAWFTGGVGQLVPETPKAQDYHQSFKSDVMSPDFEFCGANAGPCVEFTPDGLQITLPAGWPGERPGTGVTTRKPIAGDFEITVTFEFLQDPQPGESQTLFSLDVVLDKPGNNYASICRSVAPDGKTNFLTWMSLEDKQTGKPLTRGRGFPTKTKAGRLRLVRWGSVLSYYVAEGTSTKFNLLHQYPFGNEDVKEVRILGSTGGRNASLDVRVTDLHIRLQGFTKPAPIVKSPGVKREFTPTRDYPQEYIQSFKGTSVQPSGWDLEGPVPERCVKFEPAGLRITLPAGRVGEGPSTGVAAGFTVKGDFEITMDYEILNGAASADLGDVSTRLSLVIFKDTPKVNVATLSRSITPKDGVAFVAWQSLWNEAAGKGDTLASFMPSKAMTGRLRLVRSGADLFFCVAEGTDADFKVVKKFPFGAEDLKSIRIIGSTGGEKAFLDARVTDLRIRAMALPNVPASSRPDAPQGEFPPPSPSRSRGWLATALLCGLGLILALATLASITFFLRKRFLASTVSVGSMDQPTRQGSVLVPCPACGKKLKIKTELAGKKVKCPGCGKLVFVPAAAAPAQER